MKLTTIAAKLRMTVAEMDALAALGDNLDCPVEFCSALYRQLADRPEHVFNALKSTSDRQVRKS
jgi:hypothetical protein